MTALLLVEMQRDLARRLVRVLVLLGVVATVVVGLIVAANSQPPDAVGYFVVDTFHLTDLWTEDGGEAVIVAPIVFLAIGGLLAGASTVGAEWRAGTMATLLTWEPRRVRVALAKLTAAVVLAFAISLALLVFFTIVLALVASTRGSTEGVDGAWLRSFVGVLLRGSSLVAFTAGAGASIAMLGRNTAAALGAGFAYLLVGENLLRAWKPWTGRWLFGENATIFLTWDQLDGVGFSRGPLTATTTLAAYLAVLAAAAVASLRARDVASS